MIRLELSRACRDSGACTLVPLRAIFEALGATVEWEQSTQTVTAVKDDITIILKIGDSFLTKNGERIALDVPAKIVGGRTLVPARAVAESFGADVQWDGTTRTVTIVCCRSVIKRIAKRVSGRQRLFYSQPLAYV